MITSKNNNQYKRIKKLLSSSKARREEGRFVVEGERIVKEAPLELLDSVCMSASYAKDRRLPAGVTVFSDDIFRSLSDTVTPQGIMAVIKQPSYTLGGMTGQAGEGEKALYLLLDDIRDPGNLGTIVRTAEAAGASGIILSPGCADIFNPKVIRSTMGSIYRVPFVTAPLKEAAESLKISGAAVYAACLEAEIYYNEAEYGRRCAFIIGNEANGISPEVIEAADEKIKIPMAGKVESLNAAISAAIIMYGIK